LLTAREPWYRQAHAQLAVDALDIDRAAGRVIALAREAGRCA
jgi:hypothetical protein